MLSYNANLVLVDNSVFENIEEHAINYIRETPNIELPGGKLIIKNSVFSNVFNQEKGIVIRSKGIHEVAITNSVFVDSYKIKNFVELKGDNNEIVNCLVDDSGFIKTTQGAKQKDILFKNPKWDDKSSYKPSKDSPLLKKNNNIETIGLKQ